MRKNALLFLLFLLGIPTLLLWDFVVCKTWNYKITVNIETPEGLKTGSAVRKMYGRRELAGYTGGSAIVFYDVKGEAVVVDLGERGVLFAVMGTNDYYTFINSFPVGPMNNIKTIRAYAGLHNAKTSLALKDRPLMVMFKDVKDPKTVTPVYRVSGTPIPNSRNYKYTVEDRFEEIFGKGVKLKDITIETTNEPVTWGIEKHLGWLPSRANTPGALGGSSEEPFEDPTGLFLTGIEFSQGRFW